MKLQRHFVPIGGEFVPESVAGFIGICIMVICCSLTGILELNHEIQMVGAV
jgi:hypothetical protein